MNHTSITEKRNLGRSPKVSEFARRHVANQLGMDRADFANEQLAIFDAAAERDDSRFVRQIYEVDPEMGPLGLS